ncbi:Ankyrin repeat-containing domain protein [Naviculisporaceae sp. PSN 640]
MLLEGIQLVNACDTNGRTALSWAAARSDRNALHALLDAGADLWIPDCDGQTPLFHGIKVSDITGARTLVGHASSSSGEGGDIIYCAMSDVFGSTPLHVACHAVRDQELVKFLLTKIPTTHNSKDLAIDAALHHTIWRQ